MKPIPGNYSKLIDNIRNFCKLIREIETYPSGNLMPDLLRVLSLISRDMERLDVPVAGQFFALPDLDYRFDMFCRLLEILAPQINDSDPESWETAVGNLADDLTDLYFELQRGLDLLDLNTTQPLSALSLWRTGYQLHWKEHLASALQQLSQYGSRHFN